MTQARTQAPTQERTQERTQEQHSSCVRAAHSVWYGPKEALGLGCTSRQSEGERKRGAEGEKRMR